MKNKIFKADNNFGGTLAATVSAAEVTTAHLTPVPTEAPGVIVLKAGEAQEEHIYYKEKDAGAGTISGLIRDYTNLNGGVGFEHINTTPFEVMQSSEYINNLVDALIEGFIDEQQTLLYVSTSSFTVKTDKTSIYTAGRIIRFSQDNTKIVTVVSSSYSGGTGLTTVVTDNSVTNVPNPVVTVEIAIQPKNTAFITAAGAATLLNKVLTLPQFNDTSSDHQYVLAVSELTADRTITLPLLVGNDVFVFADFIQKLTAKRIKNRVYTTTSTATLTPEKDTYDEFALTAQAANLTIANHSTTTPDDGDKILITITPDATPRTLTFGTNYVAKAGVALPTTTTASKTMVLAFRWDAGLGKYNLLAVGTES